MKKKLRVYLDTSVISAQFDRRIPEMRFFTNRFFKAIEKFEPYISEVVLAEIGRTKDTKLQELL
jgi:predicted nucleic acid-binding protein